MKTYDELISYLSFEERLKYLQINGFVGKETFGFDRYINQRFYSSEEWKRIRDIVIIRDNGCDLGIKDRTIFDRIIIHHMNPITVSDISESSDLLMNPRFLICVSHDTHNAIHYGSEVKNVDPIIRRPNDTCPWKQ